MKSVYSMTIAISLALAPAPYVLGQEPGYRSPYSVKFTFALKDLTGDLDGMPRGDPRQASTVPFSDWYSQRVKDTYGPWGAPARHFPAPEGLAKRSIDWQRQRVIAVGLRFQGYGYQHHHVPDWDPPAGWPWKETNGGRNGKGVDCSNFTAFVYNLGLGIKPTSAIKKQSEQTQIPGPGKSEVRALRIDKPASYDALVRTLRTGDLLFIRNKQGEVSHVILWVGAIGEAPDKAPLVLDSTGEGAKDSSGTTIPHGIHLRPFSERSWYFRSLSHVHRILHTPDDTGRATER
jgi:hypothetical protein